MRFSVCAAMFAVVLWAALGSAQMRGSVHVSGGSRPTVAAHSRAGVGGGLFNGGVNRLPSTTAPGFRTFRPFAPFSSPTAGFNENPFILGRENLQNFGPFFRRFPHRFGSNFGFNTPFWGAGWGWWPYTIDYSTFSNDRDTQMYQAQLDQQERLQAEMRDDERRRYELERQLADQRAADAVAARNTNTAPSSSQATTPTQRDVAPTVLVYRDQRREEVRSYAITSSAVYDFNPNWTRKIPISDLDVPATIAANQQRGVTFKVPNSASSRK